MTRLCAVLTAIALAGAEPLPVAHRGLAHHAPENTRSAFTTCVELRLGYELDVRRTRDGRLVVLHDATLDRTTDGTGPLAAQPFDAVRGLDAGLRFDAAFAGLRVPTLEEAFAPAAGPGGAGLLVAVDLKEDDERMAADVVAAAKRAGVLDRVMWIGKTIESADLRRRLRAADAGARAAVLAQTPADLDRAAADADAAWVYTRFVPDAAQVRRVHDAGKRLFVVGPTVAGNEPANWQKVREARADALLTDYPLECRQSWRGRR
jgi:glycerophosphoryl diester phosphodiesterase